MIEPSPSFSDGGSVGQHTDSPLDFSQVTAWDDGWWLVIDTDFETGGAPVDELDGPLGLDGGDSGVDVFGDDITSVKHTAGHVFTVPGVTFDHLVGWLEASVGDLSDGQLFVVSFFSTDDWSVSDQRKVNPGVWDQVGLKLGQVDVEGTVEPQRGSDGRDNLTNEPVQVGVSWPFDVQVPPADVVDGFVIDHESAIGVFQSGMGGQNGVVWLDDSGGDLGSWVDSKLQFGFLAVVD